MVPHALDAYIVYFRRVFIAPAQSQTSFRQCRQFLAIDGTFLKAHYQQTLLLAVTVDGNGHCLILAWAIVESENAESWAYFFEHFKAAIPKAIKASIMSHRENGLHIGVHVLGPDIIRLHCLKHLHQNFIHCHGQKL